MLDKAKATSVVTGFPHLGDSSFSALPHPPKAGVFFFGKADSQSQDSLELVSDIVGPWSCTIIDQWTKGGVCGLNVTSLLPQIWNLIIEIKCGISYLFFYAFGNNPQLFSLSEVRNLLARNAACGEYFSRSHHIQLLRRVGEDFYLPPHPL